LGEWAAATATRCVCPRTMYRAGTSHFHVHRIFILLKIRFDVHIFVPASAGACQSVLLPKRCTPLPWARVRTSSVASQYGASVAEWSNAVHLRMSFVPSEVVLLPLRSMPRPSALVHHHHDMSVGRATGNPQTRRHVPAYTVHHSSSHSRGAQASSPASTRQRRPDHPARGRSGMTAAGEVRGCVSRLDGSVTHAPHPLCPIVDPTPKTRSLTPSPSAPSQPKWGAAP